MRVATNEILIEKARIGHLMGLPSDRDIDQEWSLIIG
jgi:hypothetical protein